MSGSEVLSLLAGDLRPEMVEAVRRCAEQLRTGLLTNNFVGDAVGRRRAPLQRGARPLRRDRRVVSRSACASPTPASTSIACERLAIEPAEAVFLDDLGVNLKPARAMGMTTIKVDDPALAIAELEQVVGFPLG